MIEKERLEELIKQGATIGVYYYSYSKENRMKKVLIDHQNFCFSVVDMDDIDNKIYLNNSKETNTISDILTSLELQRLIEKGYKQLKEKQNENKIQTWIFFLP